MLYVGKVQQLKDPTLQKKLALIVSASLNKGQTIKCFYSRQSAEEREFGKINEFLQKSNSV